MTRRTRGGVGAEGFMLGLTVAAGMKRSNDLTVLRALRETEMSVSPTERHALKKRDDAVMRIIREILDHIPGGKQPPAFRDDDR